MTTSHWAVLLVVAATALGFIAPAITPGSVIVWYAVLFVPYLVLVSRVGDPKWNWKLIALTAICIRVALAFAEPILSYDISRYVWEGRVILEGFNPYVESPVSWKLQFLRDDVIYPTLNHATLTAIYPPGSQLFFTFIALFGGGWTVMKLAFIVVEIAGALGVFWLFRNRWPRSKFESGLALYALNPLIFNEVAWSGHLDVLAWIPLVISLMWIASRPGWKSAIGAGALFGISITAKVLAVVLIPYLLLRRPWSWTNFAQRGAFLTVALVIVSVTYVPFLDAGATNLFGAFGKYVANWQNNEGYYRLFERTTLETLRYEKSSQDPLYHFSQYNDFANRHGLTKSWNGVEIANTTFSAKQIANRFAKLISAMVMAFFLLACLLFVRDPVRGSFLLLLALYAVAPTVHPWYVAWLVPFLVWRRDAAGVAFSALVLLGYWSWISLESGGRWRIPDSVLIIEYGLLTWIVLQDKNSKISRMLGGSA